MPKKRPFLCGERGISPVVSAALVMALVVMGMGVYLQQVVPVYQKKEEFDHMNEARAAILDLQSMILSRTSGEVSLPMSTDPTPIFTLPPPESTIEVTPAKWVKRFQPVADAYVDESEPNTNFGTDGNLSVRSLDPSNNRRIYIKFDVENQLGDINPDRISEAWLALYCEDQSHFYEAPWDLGGLYDPVAHPAACDNFYFPSLPVKVEAREVSNDWEETGADGIKWNNQPWTSPADGGTIMAMSWPWEDNHMIKENEAWCTWEVTAWVREMLTDGENVSILLKASDEYATLDRFAQFSSRERESAGRVINENEGDSYTVLGHPPYVKPYLAVFYENIYDNVSLPGPPLFDNWGALVEGGSIKFNTNYYQFPSTSFTIESGALFQQLYGEIYTLMISDPGVVVGEKLDEDTYHDNTAIYLNRYRIINSDKFTSASDVNLKVTVTENFDNSLYPTSGPDNWTITSDGPMRHLENVTITFRTDFEWGWKYFLRDLTVRWNASANLGGLEWWANYYPPNGTSSWWSNNIAEFMAKLYVDRNVRLYAWGRDEDPTVQDIFFYDRTYDVEVDVIV